MASQAKHIIVHGRVQGVGFRFFVQHTAERLGLHGNVRNCDDGTVEIVVEGNPKRIVDFIGHVEKGPPLSRVSHMDIHDVPAEGNYSSFEIEGW